MNIHLVIMSGIKKRRNLIRFLATAYHATVEGGHFTATGDNSYARATEVMNSKCINDFRWSVALRTDEPIWIGIATKLQRTDDNIKTYDRNAILVFPTGGSFFPHERLPYLSISKNKSFFGSKIVDFFQSKIAYSMNERLQVLLF